MLTIFASLAWALTAWARLDQRGKKSTCLNPLSEYRTLESRLMYIGMILLGTVAAALLMLIGCALTLNACA
jgi:hypothetical protein